MIRPHYRKSFLYFLFVLALALLGYLLPEAYRSLAIDIMIFGIYAMAFDILYGFSNQFSYGQALFFGMGAYSALIPMLRLGVSIWIALIMPLLAGLVVGASVGFISVRTKGAYFVIMSIIANIVAYLLAEDWTWLTGGSDGLSVPLPTVNLAFVTLQFQDPLVRFYFALLFFLGSLFLMKRFIDSPIGKVLVAIRENEERVSLLGYNVFRYKLLAFIVSAFFSCISGGLYAIKNGYASADYFGLTYSGLPVVWAFVGGTGNLLGSVLGVLIVQPILYFVGSIWRPYQVIIGVLMILTIMLSPRGITGYVQRRLKGGRRDSSGHK